MIDVEQALASAPHIEVLPESVARLAALVGRELPHVGPVAKIVQYDRGLSVKLLRAANAAANGNRLPISSVQNAVVYLGTGTVLSLAMSSAVGRSSQRALPGYGLRKGELWAHGAISSVAAERAGAVLGLTVLADAVTAALLHDVGKTLLDPHLRGAVLARARELGLDEPSRAICATAEAAVLGIDHAEIGARLAARWGLPDTLVQAIRFHHTPSSYASTAAPDPRLQLICDVAHVSDLVAHVIRRSGDRPGEVIDVEVDAHARGRLGLTDVRFTELCERTAGRMGAALTRYAVAVGTGADQAGPSVRAA